MNTSVREKLSTQAAPDLLLALRRIAESQGRQFSRIEVTHAQKGQGTACPRADGLITWMGLPAAKALTCS